MVIVTFNVDENNKDAEDEINFPEADNFGISTTGDLILVKIQQTTQQPGMPPQTTGSNLYAFAAGTWNAAKVEPSAIKMPPGVVMTPGRPN